MKAFQTYRQQPGADPLNPVSVPDMIRFEPDDYAPVDNETLLPALPVWNAATHRLEWTGSAWRIIALNAVQLAAKTAEASALAGMAADMTEKAALRLLVAALDSGTGTTVQRLARLERFAMFLLKRYL